MFWKRTEKVTKASYDTMVERYEASIKSKDDTIGRVCTERDNARKTSEGMLARNLELQARVIASDAKLEAAMASLAQIAAQETATANATVKRMARMAREGVSANMSQAQTEAA